MPYVADTNWAACLVAKNQNARDYKDLQCPHDFIKIDDEAGGNRGCSNSLGKKRVCCLLRPTTSVKVRCGIMLTQSSERHEPLMEATLRKWR